LKGKAGMTTLQQAATLAAYEQRNSLTFGRREITEQMARDLAEPLATAFVHEHLNEYEDVGDAIKQYINTFVEVFHRENGLLTPVQYEAHVQAVKDAEKELQLAREWGRTPQSDPVHIGVSAQFAAWQYISIRFIPITLNEKAYQEQAQKLLEDPETQVLYRQYINQYTASYKERILQPEPLNVKDDQDQGKKKKRWGLF
jgi:hypothetical protein